MNSDPLMLSQPTNELDIPRPKRTIRACDSCKRKKIKCGGPLDEQDGRCLSCVEFNEECTFLKPVKKRGPRIRNIAAMQERINNLEALVKDLRPDLDISNYSADHSRNLSRSQRISPVPGTDQADTSERDRDPVHELDDGLHIQSSSDEEEPTESLEEWLATIRINPLHQRYTYGNTSSAKLIERTVKIKKATFGSESTRFYNMFYRPDFWRVYSWEIQLTTQPPSVPAYDFPEPDLLHALVDSYLNNTNLYSPLFHAPTFLRSITEGLHHREASFGQIVLCVCAIESRFSDDPRVMLPGSDWKSAGWKWFNQIHIAQRTILTAPSLYDLQLYYLAIQFLQGSSVPHIVWSLLGTAMRLTQDIDLHRKKTYTSKPSAHDELWKRAFWCLLLADRTLAGELGRTCSLHDQDIDTPFPIECDDEYWDTPDPSMAFKQPPEKPSRMTAFVYLIKVKQIQDHALRTILAPNKQHIVEGTDLKAWEQRKLSEINSELNYWFGTIPPHLKWESQPDDTLFFNQSAIIHLFYHHLLIVIHRPFLISSNDITSGRAPNSVALAVCTSAARSCIKILESLEGRNVYSGIMVVGTFAAFTSGVVLLLSALATKRADLQADVSNHMELVDKCLRLLKSRENRILLAGRLYDVLIGMSYTGNAPLDTRTSRTRTSAPPWAPHIDRRDPMQSSQQSIPAAKSFGSESVSEPYHEAAYSQAPGADLGTLDIYSVPHNGLGTVTSDEANSYNTPTQPGQWDAINIPTEAGTSSMAGEEGFSSSDMLLDQQLLGFWSETSNESNPAGWASLMEELRWSESESMWDNEHAIAPITQ